ncbi:MAG: hypothetical protein HFI86_03830 [Bacilli bacterium]|nr:hypothetical protein [Bacilli bacterium]
MSSNKKLKFISLISDTTFKYLFKNPETKKWLIDIVLNKCGIDLTNYKIFDNEDNTGSLVKDYKMDLVFNKDNDYVIIECNRFPSKFSNIKARQYLYRKASFGFDKGDNYLNPPRVKLIMFNNYQNDKIKNANILNYTLNDKTYNITLDDIEIFEIYLPNYHKMCYDNLEVIDKRLWLFGIKIINEAKSVIDTDNQIIIKELERLAMNNKFIDEYDYENVQKKLLNSLKIEGYQDGVNDGSKKEKQEIAKRLLSKNFTIEEISDITELSISEIKNL